MDCSSELLVLWTTIAISCSTMFCIVAIRAGAAGVCAARAIFFGGYTTLIDEDDVPLL